LRRGSSAKRAPVSTTHASPSSASRARSAAAREHVRRVGIEVHVVERQRDAA
jgi:hypothetical protein